MYNSDIVRMRTFKQTLIDLIKDDPNSSLTKYGLRQMVITGEISHIRRGKKILIDYDELLNYLSKTGKKNTRYRNTRNPYIQVKVHS